MLSDEVLEKLSDRALSDPNPACRSGAINIFLNLIEGGESDVNPSCRERYCQHVGTMLTSNFRNGALDRSPEVRLSWIKLVGAQTQTRDGEATSLAMYFQTLPDFLA